MADGIQDWQLAVEVAPAWRAEFPEAHVGVLVLKDLANPTTHDGLRERVREIEADLRQRYAGMQRSDLAGLPTVQACQRHYRAFGQTYHVLRQLESVALKGKPLASPSALVLAMFAAELQSLLLTAGHDLAALEAPIVVDVSQGRERFVGIGGQEHLMRGCDMFMRDQHGIISAVIYGPDRRTHLSNQTTAALFTTYAPSGIDVALINEHFAELARLTRCFAPQATVALQGVYP